MASGIGETLRAARRQQGRSLGDAAAATRVRETYLAALEEEEFASLGGDVYVKGFLRSYARFLGVDPEPLLERYRSEHETGDDLPPLPGRPVSIGVDSEPGLPRLAVLAAVLLALLAAFALLNRGRDAGQNEPPAPPPVTGPADTTGTFDPNAPAVDPDEIVVDATSIVMEIVLDGGESWLRVIVDGEEELPGEIQPDGVTLHFTAQRFVELRAGNAGVVHVVVNGRELGPLGGDDEVVDRRFVVAS